MNGKSNVSGPLNVRLAQIEAIRTQTACHAVSCLRWLRLHGFEVLKVEDGHSMPRIYVRAGAACAVLEGAVRAYEHIGNFERRYYTVVRHDCEIRWADQGGNA